ncbi:3-oxoacyl-ACP synthase [Pedobacter sp. GR22-10]|jgi:transcription elongation GreA/GreB family factor|uniref:3-oxoacyl-ACP synthase n=1 Tax=Pedobacter TaxID=84567 RepID=UPI002245AF69|nr:3-oxoacyl-ACP synthase [Pedobacter sp. GR22-10]MCX2429357.1 3-oxoacyl-ACP synthase [Pedobacter sp. GR22-10]
MPTLKSQLYQLCLTFIQNRIENIEYSLQQARQASNDDTKSSAGDKYETTREMMQQEMDRNSKLLYEAGQQKISLQQIESVDVSTEVKNGSLVFTSEGNFYISISAGELHLDGQQFFAVSQAAPIGKLFIGKKVGDELGFNGKKYVLIKIL